MEQVGIKDTNDEQGAARKEEKMEKTQSCDVVIVGAGLAGTTDQVWIWRTEGVKALINENYCVQIDTSFIFL